MEKWTKYCECGKYVDHLEKFTYQNEQYFYCSYCKLHFDAKGNQIDFKEKFSTTYAEILNEERSKKREELDIQQEKEHTKFRKQQVIDIINIKIKNLYYLLSKENLASVLEHGILSRNKAEHSGLIKKDLSMEAVQNLRHNKEILLSNGIRYKVHNLVPLYFTYKTPSSYLMWQKDQEVALICVNKKILFAEGISYAFADGNIANSETEVYTDLIDLDQLDWANITTYKPDYRDPEVKRIRMSELLINPEINPKFIEKIIFPTTDIENEFSELIKKTYPHISLITDPSYFG